MKNLFKSSPVIAVFACVIAYPWMLIVLPLLIIGLFRDAGSTVVVTVFAVTIIVAFRIALPGPTRFVFGLQHMWAKKVFDVWKLIEMKKTVARAETRMRETVVSESRPVNDLGSDLDAS